MKNNRIRNAYDSINPTPVQKQQMLDAILSSADLKESPRQTRRTREPVVYTAKQSTTHKKTNIFGTLAAGIALILVAGFGLSFLMNREPIDPVANEPTSDSTVPMATAGDHYAPVLEKYRRAMGEGWTKEQCEIEGISTRMQAGGDFTKVGYALLDLDDDGREELLIAEESVPHIDNIWDLYTTLEDGTPIQLWMDEQDGGQCRLCEGNTISISYSFNDELELTFYDLIAGQLEMIESLMYEDEDTVVYVDAAGKESPVTAKEAMDISYSYTNQKLNLVWLDRKTESLADTDALERYTPVLEKYRTALTEHWDQEKCYENDISMIAASSSGMQNNLGWCLQDIDGNGTQELIISYGNESGALVDLYAIQPEGVLESDIVKLHGGFEHYIAVENGICHLAKSEGASQYTLCTDGIIRFQIVKDGTTSWCNYLVKPWGLELQDVMIYYRDNEDAKAYAYGPHEQDLTYITKEKAGEFISAHQSDKIDVTPIVDWDQYDVDSKKNYSSVMDIYRQALTEKWDMEKCSDNDISLMISRFTEDPRQLCAVYPDLDENGIPELMISDGMMIYDLYTLENGAPVKLLTGWERNAYRYCEDNIIFNHGSSSAFSSSDRYYRLENGQLVLLDAIVFDASIDPNHPWFRSDDGETPGAQLTEQEANAIRDSYKELSVLGIPILK